MEEGLKQPPRGLKKQLFGAVLIIVGLVDMAVTFLIHGQLDGVGLFFIAAGAVVLALGTVERGKADDVTPTGHENSRDPVKNLDNG